MHVVFLSHGFPVEGLVYTSGAGNYVANMAKTLVKFGHEVTVVVEAYSNDIFEWEGVCVHKIRATRGFKNTGRPMPTYKKFLKNLCRSFWYNQEVNKINRKTPVDIVQCVNTYGIGLLRRKRIPYTIRISDYPPLISGANREEFDFDRCVNSKRLDEDMQFWALKAADILIAPSYLMKSLVEKKTAKKVHVVEGPIIVDDYNLDKVGELDVIPNKYWVTYGAMSYLKEVHILAQIIDDLLDEYPDMKYVMIGKDRELLYQGEFIKASDMYNLKIIKNRNRFIFTGEISDRKKLYSIVKNAYACILPTRIDNLPNTCMESMALGKIVVSTFGTSVEQLITSGYNGFLAGVDNADDLYSKIELVMRMPADEKIIMEERAKERTKNLNPEYVYFQMIQLYENAIKKYKGV